MNGFVVLHRKILDWEWYDDPNVMRLFIHGILMASHKDTKWRGTELKRGQFISSYDKLSIDLGLTVKQVRIAQEKLESTGEWAHEGHTQFTVFTIKNYSLYQYEGERTALPGANEGQTRGNIQQCKQLEQVSNKDISVKSKKQKLSLEALPDDWKKSALDYWQSKTRFDISPDDQFFKFQNHHQSKGTLMIDWKAAWRTWYANAVDYQKHNQDIPARAFKPMKRAGSEE
jgi:hypothetical protein